MSSSYRSTLSELGLNETESKIYTTLLRHGQNPAAKISQLSKVSRTNTYNVLEMLIDKGLVIAESESSKTFYRANHPDSLFRYLDSREDELRSTRNRLSGVIDSLISDYQLAQDNPGVFSFEGYDGITRANQEIYDDREDMYFIQDRAQFYKYCGEHSPSWVSQRLRYSNWAKIITPANDECLNLNTPDKSELRSIRYADPALLPFQIDLKMNSKKVMITTFRSRSPVAIVISDPQIAGSFLMIFELLWSLLGPEAEKGNKKK